MKIKEVTRAVIFYIETDQEDYNRYIRWGSNCWTVTVCESDEPVYNCEELEQMFQDWQATKKEY